MSLAPGTMLTPNLLLERELGKGGMGTVWLAQNRALGNRVAVKVMHAPDAADSARRFEQEARVVAQIDHPHVVKIFDFGVTPDGRPFIVMELLRGEDLGQRLARVGQLSVGETVAILTQCSRALARAHEMGVVHRDIKPANIFLLAAEGEVFVKVLDFGIAKLAEATDDVTKTGAMLGTPFFMSPEQLVDPKRVDLRTDLWSLAVVTYSCLTGARPFEGDTLAALAIAVCTQPYEPPRSRRPDLPPALDAWMSRALQRKPEHRFQSARELADALAAAASGALQPHTLSVNALPASQPYPMAPMFHAAPQVWSAPQPAPPRAARWPWVIAAVGLLSLAASVALIAMFTGKQETRSKSRSKSEVLEPKQAAPSQATPTTPSEPPSSEPPSSPTEQRPSSPAPVPTAVTATPPKSGRKPPLGVVNTCWKGNEGAVAGTPASSATISAFVDANGHATAIRIEGPARQHKRFVACCVTRLSETNWGAGEHETMSFGVSLPPGK